tara:strand:+ start:89 stop:412 length:324 start_codon:yes stop_codon:yes gene_type:complete
MISAYLRNFRIGLALPAPGCPSFNFRLLGISSDNEDGSIVIVFNGEIYSFQAIRSNLKLQRAIFRVTYDTYVLMYHYLQERNDLLKMLKCLNGFFVFAIFKRGAAKS